MSILDRIPEAPPHEDTGPAFYERPAPTVGALVALGGCAFVAAILYWCACLGLSYTGP